jgi:hypothetical protein
MRDTINNTGGYPATIIRPWLEGADGDGNGPLATKLRAELGGEYLYTIRKPHSIKGNYAVSNFTLWLPTEIEMIGYPSSGDEANVWSSNVQFPIYQKSGEYRSKKLNGAITWYWLSTPQGSTNGFCLIHAYGFSVAYNANQVGGISPVFCVA